MISKLPVEFVNALCSRSSFCERKGPITFSWLRHGLAPDGSSFVDDDLRDGLTVRALLHGFLFREVL